MSTDLVPARDVAIIKRGLAESAVEDALQLFDMRQRAKLALLLEETESIAASARTAGKVLAPIELDEEEAALVALVGRSYKVEKMAEALRVERVAPLNREVAAVNALIKGAFAQLLARFGGKGEAERVIAAYRRMKADRLQRERQEAERRAVEAAERQAEAEAKVAAAATVEARVEAAQAVEQASRDQMLAELDQPREMPRGVVTEDGRVGFSQVWDFEVVDPSLVPRRYLVVDEKLLRAAVRGGEREIPGVSVFQRDQLRRGV